MLSGNRDAIRIAEIVWDKLSNETKKRLSLHLTKLIIEKAKDISVVGLKLKKSIRSYSFDSDEICIDSTLDKSAIKIILSLVDYEDILVNKKEERRKCIVLMLDKSGSMIGKKLFLAASIAATVALSSYRYNYDFPLIVFDESPKTIKRFGENKRVKDVVETILLLNPYGCTNIASALEKGLEKLKKSKCQDKIGIILTEQMGYTM